MDTGVIAALITSSFALISVIGSAYLVNRRDGIKDKLRSSEARLLVCEKDRLEMRQNIQLIVGAIIGLLPESDRMRLLHSASEWIQVDVAKLDA